MPTLRILVRREQSSLFDPGERRPATRAVVEKRVDCLAMTRLYAPTPEEPPKAPGNNTMSKKRKIPAPKKTKPSAKQGSTTTSVAKSDAAATATAPKPRDPRLPAPGQSIERVYKKRPYTLRFLDEGGVETDGKVFGSLSAAARHITGFASVNGFLWAGLIARDPKPAKKKPMKTAAPAPKTDDSHPNALGEPAAQRAALKAAGIAKAPKGTPEQIASAAKARAARAAKKTATR